MGLPGLKTAAGLAAIVVFAAFLRTYGLAAESPWWDEIVTLEALDAPGLTAFLQQERAADPPMTPVYFTLAWFWSRIGGESALWMRLLSVALGLASIPVLYGLGRRLVGPKGAVLGSLAMASSLVHVYYAQEIRVYALATLLALCSMYSLVRWLEQDSRTERWLAAHIACNALLAFTHLFGVLLFGAQAMFLLMRWGRAPARPASSETKGNDQEGPVPHSDGRAGARPHHLARPRLTGCIVWVVGHAVILAALLAWLSTIDTSTIHQAADWMVRPGWREVAMMAVLFAGGRPSNENPAAHLPGGISLDLVLTGLVAVLVAWHLVRRVLWKQGNPQGATVPHGATGLLLVWMLLPTAALLAASYVWRPCFVYRYVLYASLPLYLLLGAAVAEAKWGRALGVALAAVWAYQLLAVTTGPFRPDWRSAGDWIEERVAPADTVVALQSINYTALLYNSSIPQPRVRCVDVWSEVRPAVQHAHAGGGDAWVLVWLWTEPEKMEFSLQHKGIKYTCREFPGWPRLRAYHVPKPEQP